ncbi:MAG: urease accessory protein UreD, partial [Caulobacteraceae bacterium]|nr:urease accessory protein UreD [Caulobacter sp.]
MDGAGGGAIEACFRAVGGRTAVTRLRESGSLRLRQIKGPACHGVLVNTAGGLVGGDRLALGVTLEPSSEALVTTAAAEKVYRSADAAATSRI